MKRDSPLLRQIATFLKTTLRGELATTGRMASKALLESIDTSVERSVGEMTIEAHALYYAKWVNAGRKAGLKGVPIDALIEWLRVKRISLVGGRERSIAFAVQNSIRDKGIKPAPFIDRSIKIFDQSEWLDTAVEQLMSQYIDQELEKMFEELNKKQ